MEKKESTPFVTDSRQSYGSAGNNNNVNGSLPEQTRPLPGTPSRLYCLYGQEKNVELRGHCHRQRSEGVDVKARKKLIIASILCLFFMVAEIIGGFLSNSLAIATDAAHLLTDFASFMISLFAIWLAGRPSTQRMSFGWYRAEVIGALASVLMIWVITAILVWLAVGRIINQDFEVNAKIMLITSALAIAVNLIMGFQLHHSHGGGHGHSHADKSHSKLKKPITPTTSPSIHPPSNTVPISETDSATTTTPAISNNNNTSGQPSAETIESGVILAETNLTTNKKTYCYQNSISLIETGGEGTVGKISTAPQVENMNVRAAFIHVLGDVLQSIGVFLAALVIYFKPEWAIADPICTFVFSIIVLFTTFAIMKDALLVLMEGTPSYLDYTEVMEIFLSIEGVERVHNLRIWALSINKIALSAHLAVAPGANAKKILQEATTAVHLKYNFFESTIQIEDFTPEMEDCQQCTTPLS